MTIFYVGYLKAVWLEILGPVLLGFRPEIDPGTPLDRRGSPGTSICTKNQPRATGPSWNLGLSGPFWPIRIPRSFKRTPGFLGRLGRPEPQNDIFFGPVFRGFRPKIDPGTSLDRRSPPRTSICTKSQPRRPILRPFRVVFGVWMAGGGTFETHPC